MDVRTQNIALIRDAAIKANPSIVELKEGCRVVSGKSILRLITYELYGGGHRGFYFNETSGDHGDYSGGLIFDKVLGRTIRLADILLAMGASKQGLREVYQLNPVSLSLGRIGGGRFVTWNLREDNLESQSDECLQFLADLLAKELSSGEA